MRRTLVVNADDFGMSGGVTRGIVEAHERGIVTTASLMVRRPDATGAAAYARSSARLGVGLHLELGEWTYHDDGWRAAYELVDAEDAAAVRTEIDAQLAAFRDMVGRDPTHLDSHQHVHRAHPAASILRDLGARLGVPVRHFTAEIRYCGDFHGQDARGTPFPELVSGEALVTLLERLPAGITELACHPGYARGLESSYADERERELAALCDPRARTAIDRLGIVLASFEDLGSWRSRRADSNRGPLHYE